MDRVCCAPDKGVLGVVYGDRMMGGVVGSGTAVGRVREGSTGDDCTV